MAISVNNGNNPLSVEYNGKAVSEVWYKSSPNSTEVLVWPDSIPIVTAIDICVSGYAGPDYTISTYNFEICWDKTQSTAYDLYPSRNSGPDTYGNVYKLNKALSNNSVLRINGYDVSKIQFVINSSWSEQIVLPKQAMYPTLSVKNNKLVITTSDVDTDVTSIFTSRGWKGSLNEYKWIRSYRQRNNPNGGDWILYFDNEKAPSWIHK